MKKRIGIIFTIVLLLFVYLTASVFADDFLDLVKDAGPEEVQKAISSGADVNTRNDEGKNALMLAAKFNNNPKVIEVLIKSGTNINARNADGRTALIFAVEKNANYEIIEILIKNGADVNAKNELGLTTLSIAASNGVKPEIIDILINKGANVNSRDIFEMTALTKAITSNNREIVDILLERGADYNIKDNIIGVTSLTMAAIFSNVEIIEILIDHGADINYRYENGNTPLMNAASISENLSNIEFLIKKGSDVNAKNDQGVTVLMRAAMENENPEIIKKLIKHGADVNARENRFSSSALIMASVNNKPKVIDTLLNYGADGSFKTIEGKTAYDYAKANNEELKGTDTYWRLNDAQYGLVTKEKTLDENISGFLRGSGTVNDPYLISSPEQLDAIRDNLEKHFKLVSDIDLSNYSTNNGWEPIGNYYEDKNHDLYKPFTGTFNGNGYKIKNLYINRPDENNVGLFSFVGEKGEVKNVYLENIYIEGNNNVGGLAGTNFGEKINNISLKGEITGSNTIGGLFGFNSSILKNIDVDINITGEDNIGGLIGNNIGDISGAIVNGNVFGNYRVGGVIGDNLDGEHNILISTANVRGRSNFIGGIIGEMTSGKLSYNYSFGDVEGLDSVGGVVGHIILGEIHDSQYRGNITGAENVGGFFGMNMGAEISNSLAVTTDLRYGSDNINLTGTKNVGGFGGANMAQAKLISNYAIGNIKGSDTVGGFLGLNVGKVEDAYSKGNVIGDITTSYLIGNNTGEVLNSFSYEEDNENDIVEIYEMKSNLNGGYLDSWWAALGLGSRGARAKPYLLKWADNSFDPEIRRKSLYALGMIGNTSFRSNIEDKQNIKPGNYVTPDEDEVTIYEYPNQNSYEKDELSFGSALVIGEKKKNNQDWLFIYDVNVTMGDYSIDNFVSGWVLKKQIKPAFESYVSSILDKMNYIDKGYENAKVILSDREVLLKPNSDSEIKLEIPRGTGIEVIEENFPSPSMEIGGRGGIQTYDKIEIIESGIVGWISRAGDQIPPYF